MATVGLGRDGSAEGGGPGAPWGPRTLQWLRRANPIARCRSQILQGTCVSDEQRLEHLAAVSKLEQRSFEDEHDFLYRNLSVLDDKSSSLLTFNSVLLASIAIFYSNVTTVWPERLLLGAFLLTIVSCFLCLKVVWVHWSDTTSLLDEAAFWVDLHRVRDKRTKMYRSAWYLAEVALVGLALAVITMKM